MLLYNSLSHLMIVNKFWSKVGSTALLSFFLQIMLLKENWMGRKGQV